MPTESPPIAARTDAVQAWMAEYQRALAAGRDQRRQVIAALAEEIDQRHADSRAPEVVDYELLVIALLPVAFRVNLREKRGTLIYGPLGQGRPVPHRYVRRAKVGAIVRLNRTHRPRPLALRAPRSTRRASSRRVRTTRTASSSPPGSPSADDSDPPPPAAATRVARPGRIRIGCGTFADPAALDRPAHTAEAAS